MAATNLFRKTPFNGYNRDDVLEYLTDADLKQKQRSAEYEEQIEQLKEAAANSPDERLQSEHFQIANKNITLKKQIAQEEQEIAETEQRLDEYHLPERIAADPPAEEYALREAEESLEKEKAELEIKKARLGQLKKEAKETEAALYENLSLRAYLAKINGKNDEYSALSTEKEALKREDPQTAAAKQKIAEQEKQIKEYLAQIEALKTSAGDPLSLKVQLSQTELRALKEEEKNRVLENEIREKDAKILKIETAWEESKQKFLFTQKEQDAADNIVREAKAKAEEIKAEAEKERNERLEAINTEVKNILSGAVKESEKIIEAANEKAELIIKNANLAAAEAMRRLLPMKESLSSVLSAIQSAEQPEEENTHHDSN